LGSIQSFQIDGNRHPTSGNSRGFSANQISGDGIGNIAVIKAATSNRDAAAIMCDNPPRSLVDPRPSPFGST
jgi:hypothetical protein